jgi:hypothetical protein
MPNTKDVSEHAHQSYLFAWAALATKQRPELAMLVAIPNGGSRGDNTRSRAIRGNALKAEGVKKGYPDIALNVARGGYYGLFIELKTLTGRASPEQKYWIERLNAAGNYAMVCKGWLSAKETIESYLSGRLDD